MKRQVRQASGSTSVCGDVADPGTRDDRDREADERAGGKQHTTDEAQVRGGTRPTAPIASQATIASTISEQRAVIVAHV